MTGSDEVMLMCMEVMMMLLMGHDLRGKTVSWARAHSGTEQLLRHVVHTIWAGDC